MMRSRFLIRAAMVAGNLILVAASPVPGTADITIAISPKLTSHQPGRLLVFVEPASDGEASVREVDVDRRSPTRVTIAAREISDLKQGEIVHIDGAADAFPAHFSMLPPGRYRVQAILDRNHDYAYAGRGDGDLASSVATVTLPGPAPIIVIDHELSLPPEADEPEFLPDIASIRPINFTSPALTTFFGTPTAIRGWIALPPGYDGRRRFPTVFWNNGFGGTLADARTQSIYRVEGMKRNALPPMIWVQLDQSGPTGTHEFADSANNGPWGRALTEELIPALERQYAMDARPNGRFLTGHSSGGWAALWLQVRHPELFGGAWATAPDPSDFHNFNNVDLYAPDGNFYHDARSKAFPLSRDKGAVIATTEQYARLEAVLGTYGGQIASFEWVFSPRNRVGRPKPLFDRQTGRIDPIVAAYWKDHYDIAHLIAGTADRLRDDLSGKIHLFVGTADNYYLDRSARLLETVMSRARIPATFTFVAGRAHHDLFARGTDGSALFKDIAWSMYAVARPDEQRPR